MHGMGSLDLFPQSGIHVEIVAHAYAPEDQHPIFFLDFTDYFSAQVVTLEFDLARCQRAGECAKESATSGGHDVIDGGRVGSKLIRLDTIMLGHGPVDAEQDRLIFSRKKSLPQTAFHALNRHVGLVHDFGHATLPPPPPYSPLPGEEGGGRGY
jgi:hypothetical protein